ncbi:unnamed protein product [Rhizophagus irregularis]|nr:unnamed protein product [Rhizophagus irregularis]
MVLTTEIYADYEEKTISKLIMVVTPSVFIFFFSHWEVLLRVLDIFKSVVKVLTVIIQYNSPKFYPAFARFRLAS